MAAAIISGKSQVSFSSGFKHRHKPITFQGMSNLMKASEDDLAIILKQRN